jgi:hypothetical protein
MRSIALIIPSVESRQILDHIGAETQSSLREECGDALQGEGTQIEPDTEIMGAQMY